MDIYQYWNAVLKQKPEEIRKYFHHNAIIRWHNTNEQFNVDEFIIANCKYPNNWNGKIERVESFQDLIITVTHVYSVDQTLSFHATSFIKIKDDKIISIDEYWGDDGDIPQWRKDMNVGRTIR